jgi:hypothetical protein
LFSKVILQGNENSYANVKKSLNEVINFIYEEVCTDLIRMIVADNYTSINPQMLLSIIWKCLNNIKIRFSFRTD